MTQPVHYRVGAFPPKELEWERLIPLIGPASAAVARYDGLLAAIPNTDVLLSPLVTQEAVLSSRIEGTQATMWSSRPSTPSTMEMAGSDGCSSPFFSGNTGSSGRRGST